jgi:hypothetical protein
LVSVEELTVGRNALRFHPHPVTLP